jgi:hypothetical protein
MNATRSKVILIALAVGVSGATAGFAQGPAGKKAQQVAAVEGQRRVMFEAVDTDGDRKISQAELRQAYVTKQLESPKIPKRGDKGARLPDDVSADIFNLVDTNDDGAIEKSEVEKALLARVIVYKYHYVPTPEEQKILAAAREHAMANESIRLDMDEAAALQKNATDHWDDASLQKKANSAMERARKNLHKEMMAIDPRTKEIIDTMMDDKP